MMMSLTSLSIDAMMTALPQIGKDLNVANQNNCQLIISIIFVGQALGQLFFGPLSDKTGRKLAIYIGYALFIIGSLISGFSMNFSMMLSGRTLQGIGISAPRAVSLALARDRFEGKRMAQIMSFAMGVFILMPMIAPAIGQGILLFAGWRSIFGGFILFAMVTVIWFALRIPETLALEDRIPFSVKQIIESIRTILKIRSALCYTLILGFIQGYFLSYLSSAQQIFQEQYKLGKLFPLYFAIISLSFGTSSFLNARLVMRYGMVKLVRWALSIAFWQAVVFLAIAAAMAGHPPLSALTIHLMVSFFCIGILFGNINALVMQPLGHMAGIGAAVIGSLSTLISVPLGVVIGHSYNGTVLPLVIGMVVVTGISIITNRLTGSE